MTHPATYVFILILTLFLVSCAAVKVNRVALSLSPYEVTEQYGFKVSGLNKIATIDKQFTEVVECLGITDPPERFTQYKIAVVPRNFKCPYHKGTCNGEFAPSLKLIIVTEKGIRIGVLKHEWGHASGLLPSNHSRQKELEHCFKN